MASRQPAGEPRRAGPRARAEWRSPRPQESGLVRYLETIREWLPLIAGTIAVTTLAAILYLAIADKTYEAEADLLVTPVSNDETFTGLPLIRESDDPTRDVETIARLVTARDVAERAKAKLRTDESIDDLLDSVEVAPIAQSNIVAITAESGDPQAAADLANAFGSGVVADRTEQLQRQLDQLIAQLRERVAAQPIDPSEPGSLAQELSRLETLRAGPDPTLRLETDAAPPEDPASPKPLLTILAGLLGGAVLGIGGAFALQALDPRLRREDQLRERYAVPILARIPREVGVREFTGGGRRLGRFRKDRQRRALPPGRLSATTREAYRTLRAMLEASHRRRGNGGSVLVTGPSPSEGKTTTAINLAAAFAMAGHSVILIEADFRRPTVGEALGVQPTVGIGKVVLGEVPFEEAIVPTSMFGDRLGVLLADSDGEALPELLSLPAADALIDEAKRHADYVVIDSPPLTEVIDALPIAQQVDDVLVVVRLGSSKLPQLARLADLLSQNDIRPSGFVVVGVGTSTQANYYLSSRRERFEHAGKPVSERTSGRRTAGPV